MRGKSGLVNQRQKFEALLLLRPLCWIWQLLQLLSTLLYKEPAWAHLNFLFEKSQSVLGLIGRLRYVADSHTFKET